MSRVNSADNDFTVAKEENTISGTGMSMVSGGIWYYEVYCRIFPNPGYPNWLFVRKLDDFGSYFFTHHDPHSWYPWFDPSEKINPIN